MLAFTGLDAPQEEPEPYSIRIMLGKQAVFQSMAEIWKSICNEREGVIRFFPTGFQIFDVNATQKVSCCFEFYAEQLIIYKYEVLDTNGQLASSYMVKLEPEELYNSIKGGSKIENIHIKVHINPSTYRNTGLFLGEKEGDCSACKVPTKAESCINNFCEHVDYYRQYYINKKPVVATPSKILCKHIKKCCYNNCNFIKISLDKNGYVWCNGYKEEHSKMPGFAHQFVDYVDRAEMEKLEGKVRELSYTIKVTKKENWITKLSTVTEGSTLFFYMEEGYPLVIKSLFPDYGNVIFTFPWQPQQQPQQQQQQNHYQYITF
jgi:hypothetical protein